MATANRIAVPILIVLVLAAALWLLMLAPKRDEAAELAGRIDSLRESLAISQQRAAEARDARVGFSRDYQQLVLLGKAVPSDSDTASLLVELGRISDRAEVQFRSMELDASSQSATPVAAPAAPADPRDAEPPPDTATASSGTEAVPASNSVPATELIAAQLPLGATIGAAGLGVMPYKLTFVGDFSRVAEFISGLDSLVKTENSHVAVNGRLVTVDGFSLTADPRTGFPALVGNFSVTTYLTPSAQGATAGATPTAPSAPATATPTSSTGTTTTSTLP